MSINLAGFLAIVASSIFIATTIIIVMSYIRKQKPKALGAISLVFGISITLAIVFVLLLSLIGSVASSSRGINPTATVQAVRTATAQAVRTATAQAINTKIAQYYATATVNAIATATAFANVLVASTSTRNPYPPYEGKLVVNDSLRDNSKGLKWNETTYNGGGCQFIGGAYYVSQPVSGYFHACMATKTNFSSFVYQIQMTITFGDCGGILFWSDANFYNYYIFTICQNGSYSLRGINDGQSSLKFDNTTSAIKTGLGQTNLIAVVVRGVTIELYINLQGAGIAYSTSFSQGEIGVMASASTNPTQVEFTNAKVWTL